MTVSRLFFLNATFVNKSSLRSARWRNLTASESLQNLSKVSRFLGVLSLRQEFSGSLNKKNFSLLCVNLQLWLSVGGVCFPYLHRPAGSLASPPCWLSISTFLLFIPSNLIINEAVLLVRRAMVWWGGGMTRCSRFTCLPSRWAHLVRGQQPGFSSSQETS